MSSTSPDISKGTIGRLRDHVAGLEALVGRVPDAELAEMGVPHGQEASVRSDWIQRIRDGDWVGAVLLVDAAPVGWALGSKPTPVGRNLALYLSAGFRSPGWYRALVVGAIALDPEPVAFIHGRMFELPEAEERALFESLGFERTSRYEMTLPEGVVAPMPPTTASGELRRATVGDREGLIRLHMRAYSNHFDRYLFLESEDPRRDSETFFDKLFAGEWGAFQHDRSFVLEQDGRLVGATLVTQRPPGSLIADEMVDPECQGKGLGGILVGATMRAHQGRPGLHLSVTGENQRARRLYEKLGFRVTSGPWWLWYSPARVPVRPERD